MAADRYIEIQDSVNSSLAADSFAGVPMAEQMIALYGTLIGKSDYPLRFLKDQETDTTNVLSHKPLQIDSERHPVLKADWSSDKDMARIIVSDAHALMVKPVETFGDLLAMKETEFGAETGFFDQNGDRLERTEGLTVPSARLSAARIHYLANAPEARLFDSAASRFRVDVRTHLDGRLQIVESR